MPKKETARMAISKHLTVLVEKQMKQARCRHVWSELGGGYQCSKCLYFTGLNPTFNKLIKEELGGKA